MHIYINRFTDNQRGRAGQVPERACSREAVWRSPMFLIPSSFCSRLVQLLFSDSNPGFVADGMSAGNTHGRPRGERGEVARPARVRAGPAAARPPSAAAGAASLSGGSASLTSHSVSFPRPEGPPSVRPRAPARQTAS